MRQPFFICGHLICGQFLADLYGKRKKTDLLPDFKHNDRKHYVTIIINP